MGKLILVYQTQDFSAKICLFKDDFSKNLFVESF